MSSYEPSLATTLQRRRESLDRMREKEAPPSPKAYGMHPDDPHRMRVGPGTMAAKVGNPQKHTDTYSHIIMHTKTHWITHTYLDTHTVSNDVSEHMSLCVCVCVSMVSPSPQQPVPWPWS